MNKATLFIIIAISFIILLVIVFGDVVPRQLNFMDICEESCNNKEYKTTFITIPFGNLNGKCYCIEQDLEENKICLEKGIFHARQMTLIYCDYYLGNCVDKARVWFDENPDWTKYNFSLESASWFDKEF